MKQLVLRLFVTFGLVASLAQAQTLPKEIRTRIVQSVVEVLALENDTGAPLLGNQGGSGTVISTSGYILTNYHVIFDDDTGKEIKRHAIRFTENPSKEPVLKGIATLAATLPKLDLALLKITQDATGNPIAAGTKFVASPVGNPFDMVLGERLTIAGYPDIGGRTMTFTNGVFSGWTAENYRSSGTNWLKTDGKISSGNSGGGAFDEQGNLIGVPTGGIVRQLSQTQIEAQNYLRPIHLAYQLFEPNVPDTAWAGGRRPTLPSDIDATGLVAPKIAGGLLPAKIGQVWTMTIAGLPTWTLTLARLDQDGDPIGTATQAGVSQPFIAYAYETEDGEFFFHVESQKNDAYACVFDDAPTFKGSTLSGGQALNSSPNAEDWQNMKRTCTVSLQVTGAAVAAPATPAAPTQPVVTPPATGGLTASFPPKLGQTWTVTIQNLSPWRLEFTKLDKEGDPEGTGKQAKFTAPTYAFVDDEGERVFQMFSPNTTYWCGFAKDAVFSGATISNGKAYAQVKGQSTPRPMNRPCTATLIAVGSPAMLQASSVLDLFAKRFVF